MADEDAAPERHRFDTKVTRLGRSHARERHFVNPPVVRGSTVLHGSCADRTGAGKRRLEQAMVYGLLGTPTHHALEDTIAGIEGGTRCQIVSSGLAACTVPLLAFLAAGDHCLVPDSVYGPTRHFCDVMLRPLGIETTYYPPTIDAAGLAELMRPNTRVLFVESPGSHTFEVQDVPALADVAHARGAMVLMDNTWGIHFFQPFRHGVDVSIQALTKYRGRPFRRAAGQHHHGRGRDLGARAQHRDGAGAIREFRRLLAGAARRAHARGAAAPSNGVGADGGALVRRAAGGAARPPPGAPRRAGPRALEARLHRRVQPVRRRVPPAKSAPNRWPQ